MDSSVKAFLCDIRIGEFFDIAFAKYVFQMLFLDSSLSLGMFGVVSIEEG